METNVLGAAPLRLAFCPLLLPDLMPSQSPPSGDDVFSASKITLLLVLQLLLYLALLLNCLRTLFFLPPLSLPDPWCRQSASLASSDHTPTQVPPRCHMDSPVTEMALLRPRIAGVLCKALLDSSASRNFIHPRVVERLHLRATPLPHPYSFILANGQRFAVDHVVPRLTVNCSGMCFTSDFLMGPVPYDLLFGLPWLTQHGFIWAFQDNTLTTYIGGHRHVIPVIRRATHNGFSTSPSVSIPTVRSPAEIAYETVTQQLARLSPTQVADLLCPPRNRSKPRRKSEARVPIKQLIAQTNAQTLPSTSPLQGLNIILSLPFIPHQPSAPSPFLYQGPLASAITNTLSANNQLSTYQPKQSNSAEEVDEPSSWPQAHLQYTTFGSWLDSEPARQLPPLILEVLKKHRLLFPDALPSGLPPKRPYDHHILLMPGKLPTKAPIYKMPPEHLQCH